LFLSFVIIYVAHQSKHTISPILILIYSLKNASKKNVSLPKNSIQKEQPWRFDNGTKESRKVRGFGVAVCGVRAGLSFFVASLEGGHALRMNEWNNGWPRGGSSARARPGDCVRHDRLTTHAFLSLQPSAVKRATWALRRFASQNVIKTFFSLSATRK